MACQNDKGCKEIKSIISENWIVVDKSEGNENCGLILKDDRKLSKSLVPSLTNFKPYVPFTVEELSCTTRLDTWSNCNVRVIGLIKLLNGSYNLESVNESGGPYNIRVLFDRLDTLPLPSQVVQVFGEVKIVQENGSKSLINVLFFRNLAVDDLPMYTKVIDSMRRYIPLFFNDDDSHRKFDDVNGNASGDNLYSNDDYNTVCDTDCV